jgi:hypothetical protein
MRATLVMAVAGLLSGTAPPVLQAQETWPDLKGGWRGKAEAVALGQEGHIPGSDTTTGRPRLERRPSTAW